MVGGGETLQLRCVKKLGGPVVWRRGWKLVSFGLEKRSHVAGDAGDRSVLASRSGLLRVLLLLLWAFHISLLAAGWLAAVSRWPAS